MRLAKAAKAVFSRSFRAWSPEADAAPMALRPFHSSEPGAQVADIHGLAMIRVIVSYSH
jgi:hypothetical protein